LPAEGRDRAEAALGLSWSLTRVWLSLFFRKSVREDQPESLTPLGRRMKRTPGS
jgi:hypothetical protein